MILGNPAKGILAVFGGGLSNGSFAAPSKGIIAWRWEHIWFMYSSWALGLLPVGLALFFSNGTIPRALAANPALAVKIGAFGAMWGIGSLLFGVCLPRLGLAITNALVNGVLVFVGSLGPVLVGSIHIASGNLWGLAGGLTLLALSLYLCVAASVTRDRARGDSLAIPASRSQSLGAVFLAIAAGVTSAMLNIGFVYGVPLAQSAKAIGCPVFLTSVTIWVPILLGGLISNVGYPAYLIWRKASWSTFFRDKNDTVLWIRSCFMGVLWFGAILLYGIGVSLVGNQGAVYGWALFFVVSILASNSWGFATGEWKGSGAKPKLLMWVSTALLISSLALLASEQLKR